MKLAWLFPLFFTLSGCSFNDFQDNSRLKGVDNFLLPEYPAKDKALLYIIYRKDISGILAEKINIHYSSISADQYERRTNPINKVFNALTFSAFADQMNTNQSIIGYLKPGQYRTIQLNPGSYEINRTLLFPCKHYAKTASLAIKVEPEKTYFIQILPTTYYNSYSYQTYYYLPIYLIDDAREGKYTLMMNFEKNDESKA